MARYLGLGITVWSITAPEIPLSTPCPRILGWDAGGVLLRHRGWSRPRAERRRTGRRRYGSPPATARGPGRWAAADGGTGTTEGNLHAAPGEDVPARRPIGILREAEEGIVAAGAGHGVPGEGHRAGGRARARQPGGRRRLEALRAHLLAAAVGACGGAAGIGGAYKQAPVGIGGGQAGQGGQGAAARERNLHRGGGAGGQGRAAALAQGQPAGLVGGGGGIVPGFKHFDRVAGGPGHRLPAQLQRGGAGLRTVGPRRGGRHRRQAAHQGRDGGRARPVARRGPRLQPVLVAAVGAHRGIRMGEGGRSQSIRLHGPGRLARLPPQAVARDRAAGGGGRPGESDLALGIGGLQVPGGGRHLRQGRGGTRHRDRTGR